jgi:hypothetical protein
MWLMCLLLCLWQQQHVGGSMVVANHPASTNALLLHGESSGTQPAAASVVVSVFMSFMDLHVQNYSCYSCFVVSTTLPALKRCCCTERAAAHSQWHLLQSL